MKGQRQVSKIFHFFKKLLSVNSPFSMVEFYHQIKQTAVTKNNYFACIREEK